MPVNTSKPPSLARALLQDASQRHEVIRHLRRCRESRLRRPRFLRSVTAFHKTGVFLSIEIAARSCRLFGWDSDRCIQGPDLIWGKACRKEAADARNCRRAPNGLISREVVFFRSPLQTLVSAYLYHLSCLVWLG